MSPLTFRPAKREGVHLLIGLAGGTGSGKTMSAMRLAKGLAGDKPFAVLDSEANRALHYADMFQFDHAALDPPFRPDTYLKGIKAAEAAGYPVILVDSMSHVWDGPGGVLEWHDQLMDGKENKKLSSWIQPKGEHRKMVSQLLQVRAHVILCFRAQQKVEMVKVNGKWEIVEKKSLTGLDGWIPICEKNLPFELTLSILLTAENPGLPLPIKVQDQHRPFLPLDAPISEQTGRDLARWAGGASDAEAQKAEGAASELVTELLAAAEILGARDKTSAAIASTRRLHASEPDKYVGWLTAQLKRAQAAVEKARAAAGEDLFADADEPLPPTQED